MSSHNIGCISYVDINKWQLNKEGSTLLLTFNIVNILVSNMRGVQFVNKSNELMFISVTFVEGGMYWD